MAGDLFCSNYPLYTIAPLASGEFYVAGGGGEQKTGVPNGLVSVKVLASILNKAHFYLRSVLIFPDLPS